MYGYVLQPYKLRSVQTLQYVIFNLISRPDWFEDCEERDPWRYLKYAFRSRDVDPEVAEEIYRRRGIRYSAIHELANWLPGRSSLLDFMHLFFLCKSYAFIYSRLINELRMQVSSNIPQRVSYIIMGC